MTDAGAFYRNLPRLETERLVLRVMMIEDLPAVYAYASDPDVTRYLRWPTHPSLEHTEHYLRQALDLSARGIDALWAIELRASGAVIGVAHLMEVTASAQRAEVGVVVAKVYWGNGYGSEALEAVLRCAAGVLGLEGVRGVCVADNVAAQVSMTRARMIERPELAHTLWQKGAERQMLVYEWCADRAHLSE